MTMSREERDREAALSTAGIVADCDMNATSVDAELFNLMFLVVDPSRFYRAVIKNALAAYRMTKVIETSDGAGAMEVLRSRDIDVILTDYDMPVLNGVEFVRTLRWSEEPNLDAETPIIMITEVSSQDIVVEARNAGIHEFLCKPVVPRDLYERIRKTILQPRPFISVESYRGPDRRWMDRESGSDAGQAA